MPGRFFTGLPKKYLNWRALQKIVSVTFSNRKGGTYGSIQVNLLAHITFPQ